jgi:hypothetical protein
MRNFTTLMFTGWLTLAGGSNLRAADPPPTCKGDCSDQAKGRVQWSYCVDAQSGSFTGKRFFSRRDVVFVKLCNMNPFAAVVTVSVDETVATESVLSDLQAALMGGAAASQAATKANAAAKNDANTSSAAIDKLKLKMNFLSQQAQNATGADKAQFQTQLNQLMTVTDAITLLDATSQSPEDLLASQTQILERINNNLQALRADKQPFANSQKLAGTIVADIELLKPASDLSQAAALLRKQAPPADNSSDTVSHAVAHSISTDSTADALDAAASQINKLRVLEPGLAAFRDQKESCKIVATILPDYHSSRTATITANKTPVNSDGTLGTQAALGKPIDLTVGSGLFSASVGIAISPLSKISYQSIGAPSSANSSANSNSNSNIIALQENSKTRTQVMTLVNANLVDGLFGKEWCCSLHLSAGLTLASDKLSTNPEFLFGLSISALRDQLFITGGVYGGFQETLTGGYTVAGAAPSGTIPVTNQFHWKPGIAISWRVPKLTSGN